MPVVKIMESLVKAVADMLRHPEEQASQVDVSPGKTPEEGQEDETPGNNLS